MKVLITYKVTENDSSWMSSRENENESHTVEISTKQDVLNFL